MTAAHTTNFAPRSPTEAIRAGIGFVAEDRRRQSIVPDLSVRENLLLAHLGAHRGFGLGYGKREKKIDELLAEESSTDCGTGSDQDHLGGDTKV